jgi:hypothetical protein
MPIDLLHSDDKYPYSQQEFQEFLGIHSKTNFPPLTKRGLPKAIIVDIDGTLAKMNGRGPFEWSRVGEDKVNDAVQLVVGLASYHCDVIIFSGRDSVCRPETIEWLQKHKIPIDKVFMRPEGNNEKDCIIKRRLYDEHVAGKYDVQFVLDDRNQVVDMWRKDLGLTCFQVDYGDF